MNAADGTNWTDPGPRAEPRDAVGSYMGAGAATASSFLVVLAIIALVVALLAFSLQRTMTDSIDDAVIDLRAGRPAVESRAAR